MCYNKKPHEFVVVYSNCEYDGTEPTVRWCRNCGAIVVDIDVDGRTDPGRILPLTLPTYAN